MRFAALLLLSLLFCAPAAADNRSDTVADVLACGLVRGDKARLRCFESAMPALREANPDAAAVAAERAEKVMAEAREEAREDFGFSEVERRADDPFEEKQFGAEDLQQTAAADETNEDVDSISSNIVEIGRNLRGKIFVVLDNGQVWRQIDADRADPYIPNDIEGYSASIRKGLLGSYFVKVGDIKPAFKARRVK